MRSVSLFNVCATRSPDFMFVKSMLRMRLEPDCSLSCQGTTHATLIKCPTAHRRGPSCVRIDCVEIVPTPPIHLPAPLEQIWAGEESIRSKFLAALRDFPCSAMAKRFMR